MQMKLKELFKKIPGCQIKNSFDPVITGITSNSKLVMPGNLFIAKKGKTHDGDKYICEAVSQGAAAVVTDLFNPLLKQPVQIVHANPGQIEAEIAAKFYHHPSDSLLTIGVTGTNGKTTTTILIKSLLDLIDGETGLIGTIEYCIGAQRLPASHTTPDPATNQRLLREMVNHGCLSVVMEVSSHALAQKRVAFIDYDIAIFTQLTSEHLDYHQTMENYFEAKRELFSQLSAAGSKKKREKWAIINQDCSWSEKIVKDCKAKIFTYAIEQTADLKAFNLQLSDTGTAFDLLYQNEQINCQTPFVGRFNIYNTLAAMAALLTQGHPLKLIVNEIKKINLIKGRLEKVKNALDLKIYVDYAHTEDALKNVLATLSEVKKGKIITVFGCGGDRDPFKRVKMGEISQIYSDITFITSDNPRSEDPYQICQEVAKGFSGQQTFIIEPDRYQAIKQAILQAKEEDMIIIAGKGHETYQLFNKKRIEFDDSLVAQEICLEIATAKRSLCDA